MFFSKVALLATPLVSLTGVLAGSVWVRSFASEPVECSITANGGSGGDTSWFTLPSDYSEPTLSRWTRTTWQTIAFRSSNATDTQSGYYKDFDQDNTYVTFFDFGCDGTAFTNETPAK